MSDKKELSIDNNTSAIAIKALVSAVPSLGGPISSIIGDIQSIRKQERFVEFVNGITNDLKNLSDHVNNDFVSKEDFLDIFEQTSRKIVMTRQKSKRDAFRNILSNSMLSKNITYDEVEEFIRLIDRFREEHIFLLNIFKDPIKYDQETGNRVGNGGGLSTSISQIMEDLLPNWNNEFILETVTILENERLVKNIINNYRTMMTDQGINHLRNILTPKGARFVSFISSPEK
jgi:hypothetical protein